MHEPRIFISGLHTLRRVAQSDPGQYHYNPQSNEQEILLTASIRGNDSARRHLHTRSYCAHGPAVPPAAATQPSTPRRHQRLSRSGFSISSRWHPDPTCRNYEPRRHADDDRCSYSRCQWPRLLLNRGSIWKWRRIRIGKGDTGQFCDRQACADAFRGQKTGKEWRQAPQKFQMR